MLKLIWQLIKPQWIWVLVSSITGAIAGASTVALLAKINEALNQKDQLTLGLFLGFAGFCIISLATQTVSDITANQVGQKLISQVRKSLARKILSAPIDEIERYKTYRIIPILTHDVDTISNAIFAFSAFAIGVAIAIGCLIYLAWLSMPMFGLLVIALGLGVAIQYLAQARGVSRFREARAGEEDLQKAYNSINEGAKELRLHRGRRAKTYSEGIIETVDRIHNLNLKAVNIFVIAGAYGSILFFLVIALLIALGHSMELAPGVLSGFVIVLLYLKGPIDQMIGILPHFGRARVAFLRVTELATQFSNSETNLQLTWPEEPTIKLRSAIELKNITYSYKGDDDGEHFSVGPINFCINKGELVFITGNNGSGKTTLIKIILGLYIPQQGVILLDGNPISDATRDDYRQLFTTVFADFHLFSDLMSSDLSSAESLTPYLKRLDILHKVHISNGTFSTTDLSTGQRKRLALIHAYAQGRQVLVFDEWAADQDPAFRKIFYDDLLPELRAKGHTILAISHDERFFGVADRILNMSDGIFDAA